MNPIDIVSISDILKCQQEACEYLQNNQNNEGSFSANVCVICEWYIILTEKIEWLSPKNILLHRQRSLTDVWEKLYGTKTPIELQKQYEVIDSEYDLSWILLSPFAKRNKKGNYMCCEEYYKTMRQP